MKMIKNIILNNLIKELKYARKLHLAELAYRIKEQKTTIKEKKFVIKVLTQAKRNVKDIEKVKKIIQKWQKVHRLWISLVMKNRKWAKKGGSVTWHKRWIGLYQEILDYLREE